MVWRMKKWSDRWVCFDSRSRFSELCVFEEPLSGPRESTSAVRPGRAGCCGRAWPLRKPATASLEPFGSEAHRPVLCNGPSPGRCPGGAGEGEKSGLKRRCHCDTQGEGSFVIEALDPCDLVILHVAHQTSKVSPHREIQPHVHCKQESHHQAERNLGPRQRQPCGGCMLLTYRKRQRGGQMTAIRAETWDPPPGPQRSLWKVL